MRPNTWAELKAGLAMLSYIYLNMSTLDTSEVLYIHRIRSKISAAILFVGLPRLSLEV